MNKYLARLRYRQHFNFFLYQENKVMLIIAFRHQILAFRYKIVEFCCAFGGGVHCTIITILNRNKVCRKLNWIFGHGTCNPDKGLISSEKFSWKSTFATMAHCQTKMISNIECNLNCHHCLHIQINRAKVVSLNWMTWVAFQMSCSYLCANWVCIGLKYAEANAFIVVKIESQYSVIHRDNNDT